MKTSKQIRSFVGFYRLSAAVRLGRSPVAPNSLTATSRHAVRAQGYIHSDAVGAHRPTLWWFRVRVRDPRLGGSWCIFFSRLRADHSNAARRRRVKCTDWQFDDRRATRAFVFPVHLAV